MSRLEMGFFIFIILSGFASLFVIRSCVIDVERIRAGVIELD